MSCLFCFKKSATVHNSKKVTFDSKVTVVYFEHIPIEKNVCWEQVARDRVWFKRRMLDVEGRIGWVFDDFHRERVYKKLYCK